MFTICGDCLEAENERQRRAAELRRPPPMIDARTLAANRKPTFGEHVARIAASIAYLVMGSAVGLAWLAAVVFIVGGVIGLMVFGWRALF
jgi:hypothetical protein